MTAAASLAVLLEAGTYAFGQPIRGRIRVKVTSPVRVRSLAVTAFIDRIEDVAFVRGTPGRTASPAIEARVLEPGRHDFPFELTAPAGPASYGGPRLLVSWRLSAEATFDEGVFTATQWFQLVPAPGHEVAIEPLVRPLDRSAWRRAALSGCEGIFTLWAALVFAFAAAIAGLAAIAFAVFSVRLLLSPESITVRHFALPALFLLLFGGPILPASVSLLGPRIAAWVVRRRVGEVALDVEPLEVTPGDLVTVRLRFRARAAVELEPSLVLLGLEEYTKWRVEGSLEGRREAWPGDAVLLEGTGRVPHDAGTSFHAPGASLRWIVSASLALGPWARWSRDVRIVVVPRGCRAIPSSRP